MQHAKAKGAHFTERSKKSALGAKNINKATNMNQATFIGNLTANAVQRATADGAATYATFSVAVNRKTKNGAEETTYVDCVMGGNTAGVVPYLTKGKKIAVTGRVSCRAWIDRQGQPHANLELRVWELEFCGGRDNAEQPQPQAQTQAPAQLQTQASFAPQQPAAPVQPTAQPQQQPQPQAAQPVQQQQLFGSPQPTESDLPF